MNQFSVDDRFLIWYVTPKHFKNSYYNNLETRWNWSSSLSCQNWESLFNRGNYTLIINMITGYHNIRLIFNIPLIPLIMLLLLRLSVMILRFSGTVRPQPDRVQTVSRRQISVTVWDSSWKMAATHGIGSKSLVGSFVHSPIPLPGHRSQGIWKGRIVRREYPKQSTTLAGWLVDRLAGSLDRSLFPYMNNSCRATGCREIRVRSCSISRTLRMTTVVVVSRYHARQLITCEVRGVETLRTLCRQRDFSSQSESEWSSERVSEWARERASVRRAPPNGESSCSSWSLFLNLFKGRHVAW